MKPTNLAKIPPLPAVEHKELAVKSLHPAWRALHPVLRATEHGEVECLKIQDGIPVLAEVTRKKVKFAS